MDYKQAWDYQDALMAENLAVKAKAVKQSAPVNSYPAGELLDASIVECPPRHHLLLCDIPRFIPLVKCDPSHI